MYTARKIIFSFSKCSQNMVFPKKMKNDLSQKKKKKKKKLKKENFPPMF